MSGRRLRIERQGVPPTAHPAPPLILGARQQKQGGGEGAGGGEGDLSAAQPQRQQGPKLLDACLRPTPEASWPFGASQETAADAAGVWNVIGVLGKRRTGKTTLARNIAGELDFCLPPPRTTARTCGIDLLVSPERAIVLDAQAVLDGRLPPDAPPSASDHLAEFHVRSFFCVLCPLSPSSLISLPV